MQNAVDPVHLGVATGATTFLRSLGGAMGVSILGTVFLSYGFAQKVEAAQGLSDLAPRAGAAFGAIFLAAGIGLVIADVFLLLMEEKPLRSGRTEGLVVKSFTVHRLLTPDSCILSPIPIPYPPLSVSG